MTHFVNDEYILFFLKVSALRSEQPENSKYRTLLFWALIFIATLMTKLRKIYLKLHLKPSYGIIPNGRFA